MKQFISAVCFLVTLQVITALDHAKIKEHGARMISECKSKVSASDADIENLRAHKLPGTHEGLCMLECVFDMSTIMKDGKYNKEGMVAAFSQVVDDDAQLENVKKMADVCVTEIGKGSDDKCEEAKLIVDCLVKHSPNHGVDLPGTR